MQGGRRLITAKTEAFLEENYEKERG
ncbi:hypothetical protein TRIP_B20003 [uncultured Desulfatiglans sp.]|nr:hypothetical protein TRIP_B20003 [uncultured Desulfatiglans sp.]